MTLTELLEQAKKAETPEQIESMELDLAAAQEILRQKKAKTAPAQSSTAPAGDMTADEVVAELGLKKRAQVYSLAVRPHDPLPAYNVNKRVKRFPRAGVADWKRRQVERRG